jgi:3-dehydroquinate synthase
VKATEEPATTPPGERRSHGAIVFVGFMGAGKSTAARAVARSLGVEALDADSELERELGEPVEAFFDREGEPAFRAREEDLVLRLLGRDEARVVALGGGALASERVREALEAHTVAYLEVGVEDAWRRAGGKGRPLARDRARFDRLHADRVPVYEAAADAVVPASERARFERAVPALRALHDASAPQDLRMTWAVSGSRDYPVFFGRGLLRSGFFHPPGARRFVVSDSNVARHHRLSGDAEIVLPPGEPEKTLVRAEHVLRRMAEAGMGRADLVVALGGGVVGDLAGFCAAIYQRGIRHVQVPTSLVAQVDSAYGGKTGVNLPEGKNYVGAYHQPAAVLVDPAALESLPAAELSSGYAEVVKTALIAGGSLWERVRQGGEPDDETVEGCLRTKLRVVAADERDTGPRQVLNLGHTVGHAIETATGYARLRHGEAVALGLLCALRLSGQEELRREVAVLLEAHGLPLRITGVSLDEVMALTRRDKKRRDGDLPFVLVEAPGRVTPGHTVAESDLRAALEEVCAS